MVQRTLLTNDAPYVLVSELVLPGQLGDVTASRSPVDFGVSQGGTQLVAARQVHPPATLVLSNRQRRRSRQTKCLASFQSHAREGGLLHFHQLHQPLRPFRSSKTSSRGTLVKSTSVGMPNRSVCVVIVHSVLRTGLGTLGLGLLGAEATCAFHLSNPVHLPLKRRFSMGLR